MTHTLKELIEYWFYSDLDIEFTLRKGRKELLCIFESDVWYEHITDSKRDVTIKSIRHKGKHRRFIVVDGDDNLFEKVKSYCYQLYTYEELMDVVGDFEHEYKIK